MNSPALTAHQDQRRRAIADAIRRTGCYVTYVSDDADCAACAAEGNRAQRRAEKLARRPKGLGPAPAFAYTIGLYGMGHPELVVHELDMKTSLDLLNLVAHRIIGHDEDLTPGQLTDLPFRPHRLFVEEIPEPSGLVAQANNYYRRPDEFSVPAYQLTWADTGGLFPWDEGASSDVRRQPRPKQRSE